MDAQNIRIVRTLADQMSYSSVARENVVFMNVTIMKIVHKIGLIVKITKLVRNAAMENAFISIAHKDVSMKVLQIMNA